MDKQQANKYLKEFLYANTSEIKNIKNKYPEVAKAIVEALVIIDKKYANGDVTADLTQYIENQQYNQGGITDAQKRKVGKVMHEWKEGDLHIGKSDKLVKGQKQAIAIALSEAGLSQK